MNNHERAGSSFKNFILDQLEGLGDLRCRAMFGGHGLYLGEQFFGILHRGRVYFKTNTATRGAYLDSGCEPFKPNAEQTLGAYYEVPANIVDDSAALMEWAARAASI